MVIVGGTFEFDRAQRDQFLASRVEMMKASRAEAGCLEYTFCADPLDSGRVVLYERWADQAALDAHLVIRRAAPPIEGEVAPISSSIVIYEVAGERRLG
ncbi:MAG TPA: putative quinol monooxygenase [Ilumatobacteraceae bacterium]|jgi:quinol monooxygenase YgiN